MKPHPRIRKTVKWGGAAVTVLLVVVWIWSGWSSSKRFLNMKICYCEVYHGRLYLSKYLDYPRDWPAGSYPSGRLGAYFRLDLGFSAWDSKRREVPVPLWLPVFAVAFPAALAWNLDTLARRRERAHLCPKCGYDRTGIARDAKCPECGAALRNA